MFVQTLCLRKLLARVARFGYKHFNDILRNLSKPPPPQKKKFFLWVSPKIQGFHYITVLPYLLTTKYFIGRVTLFLANNYLTEYRITMEFLHIF